jgi:hypothetical protein
VSNLKRVRSFSSGTWITCAWFECDRQGFELHKSVFHEHDRRLPCDHPLSGHVNFLFCSERHKRFYANSHIALGRLPAGYRTVV